MIRTLDIYKQDKPLHKKIFLKSKNYLRIMILLMVQKLKILKRNFLTFVEQNFAAVLATEQMHLQLL